VLHPSLNSPDPSKRTLGDPRPLNCARRLLVFQSPQCRQKGFWR
jgi:hypothetical protein